MSGHVRTRSKSAGRRDDRESSQAVGPVVQPSDEQPQLEEPPTEGPDVEAAQQELTLLKTVDEPGDGPDVAEEILPTLTTIQTYWHSGFDFQPPQL
uniref:GAGE domain-containing protein n=1 Tax=Equus asinus asinus TaxID=83772 RepID=A0A8C4M684_EQUAS